ncbi:MAG: hypothetical protein ABFR53_03350 [Actinomycetota bacterium]
MTLIGPRFAILVWWLFDSVRWEAAFSSFWVTFIGFLFAPWTTLFWVLVWTPGGLRGFDWIILGIGVLLDVASYSSGAYGRRTKYTTTTY